MKRILPLTTLMMVSAVLPGQGIVGDWHGLLEVQTFKLRLVFHIQRADDGYTATMDSPDQGAKGIPVQEVAFNDPELVLKMPNLGAEYRGELDAAAMEIRGKFSQSGAVLDLNLRREALEKPEVSRPQIPKAPFPYDAEEVTFENGAAGITLAGTLTLPKEEGRHPAVILISGSGPQDRNEEVFGHKPFLVLSDHLTRQGIAVLRFDDRGVGQSTGDHSKATSRDFASDVRAGIDWLKTRAEIDPRRIGLVGHSEGGLIAPMVAAQSDDVAFIVLLAGPGVPGDEIIYRQQMLINEAEGTPRAVSEANQQMTKKAFDMLKEETDLEKIRQTLKPEIMELLAKSPGVRETDDLDQLAEQQLNAFLTPWFRHFISYDPAVALEQLSCPVLALNGEKDLQVDPEQNLPAIRAALEKGGNKNYQIVELPGLNHLFQTTETGRPSEYARIEETFSPAALQAVSDWIGQVVGQ